jgi:cytochrome P450
MTTAGTLTAIFFYLSRHPSAYTHLASAIRTTFPSAEAIQSGPLLASCTYLRAVIDECLRLSVPTTSMPWREIAPEPAPPTTPNPPTKPFVVDGHVIPPGTMMVVNTYCIMHNEDYFPDAFAFKPERWLDGGSDKAARRAFVPFGTGEATCLGKGMAYLETSLVVAKTLWHFDFARAPGEAGKLGGGWPGGKDKARARADEFQLYDGIVSDHDGPNLVFRKRIV